MTALRRYPFERLRLASDCGMSLPCLTDRMQQAVALESAPMTRSAVMLAGDQVRFASNFVYSDLTLTARESIQACYCVKNTGWETRADIAQIYVKVASGNRAPVERLVGWERTLLKPGQGRKVSVRVDPRTLANFDASTHAWVISGGECEIRISSVFSGSCSTIAYLPEVTLPF